MWKGPEIADIWHKPTLKIHYFMVQSLQMAPDVLMRMQLHAFKNMFVKVLMVQLWLHSLKGIRRAQSSFVPAAATLLKKR